MGEEDDIPVVAVPVPMPDPIPVPYNPTSFSATTVPTAPTAPTAPSYGVQHQASSFRVATTHQGSRSFTPAQKKALSDQGYTKGLTNELLLFTTTFSLRFWVVDNSGSMAHIDGNRLVHTKNKNMPYKVASCSRWKEIQGTIDYHAQLAALLEMPTTFRLLNNPGAHVGPQEFSIGTAGPELIQRDLNVADYDGMA